MVLASPLPVPLIAVAPSRVRFSIVAKAASERVMVEVMVSMPPVSLTVSVPLAST